MIGLLQRVKQAYVDVEEHRVAEIGPGLLVLLGVEKTDTQTQAQRLLERLLNYRVFSDEQGKMNLSLLDIAGELLLVPQFTLAADTRKGKRPSFSSAAPPELGQALFEYSCEQALDRLGHLQRGQFGADMSVGLINDGPVTFWLQVS